MFSLLQKTRYTEEYYPRFTLYSVRYGRRYLWAIYGQAHLGYKSTEKQQLTTTKTPTDALYNTGLYKKRQPVAASRYEHFDPSDTSALT